MTDAEKIAELQATLDRATTLIGHLTAENAILKLMFRQAAAEAQKKYEAEPPAQDRGH